MSFSHCLVIMDLGDKDEYIWMYIHGSNEWFYGNEKFDSIL